MERKLSNHSLEDLATSIAQATNPHVHFDLQNHDPLQMQVAVEELKDAMQERLDNNKKPYVVKKG